MKLPTWFRITWWALITGLAGWLFRSRLPAISQGQSTPVDVFVFLVFVALLLVPIFQEVSFFGLKFKQAIEELQKDISTGLAVLKADIQTSISNTSNVTVTLPSAPPDEQLPNLEGRIKSAVSETLRELGVTAEGMRSPPTIQADDDTLFLFKTRYTIERKLRRIASVFAEFSEKPAPPTVGVLTSVLVGQQVMNPQLAQAIRQVYSVCSPAIHGEETSDAQVAFVRDVAQEVLGALTEIEWRTIGSTVP